MVYATAEKFENGYIAVAGGENTSLMFSGNRFVSTKRVTASQSI